MAEVGCADGNADICSNSGAAGEPEECADAKEGEGS